MSHDTTRLQQRLKAATRVMVAAAALLGFVVALIAYPYVFPRAKDFDPLRYPDGDGQRVLSRVPGVNGPAVRIGRNLRVTATACNISGRPVGIRGRVFWTIVRPPGVSILVFQSAARRLPGCSKFTFSNPMPRVVQAIARERPGVLWRVNGDVTPLAAHGVPRYWQTQEFRIVS